MLTCITGPDTRYFSKNALDAHSCLIHKAKCFNIESMECQGCCRVILRYFCKGRAKLGKRIRATSYASVLFFNVDLDWHEEDAKSKTLD